MLREVIKKRNGSCDIRLFVKRAISIFPLLKQSIYSKYCHFRGAKLARYCVVKRCSFNGKMFNLTVGSGSVVEGVELHLHSAITVGDNSVVNAGCKLLTASHVTNDEKWTSYSEPIIIGDYCWLATGVIVLPGVTVGRGSVVAAGSVVTKNIPENVIVAGNPAVVIKERTSLVLSYTPADNVGMCQAWK